MTIHRTLSEPTDIHGNLSQIIWGNSDSNEAIISMADVVFVALQRTPGLRADNWEFDEEVILGESRDELTSDNRPVHVEQRYVGDTGARAGALSEDGPAAATGAD